jgi:hypothetical protein
MAVLAGALQKRDDVVACRHALLLEHPFGEIGAVSGKACRKRRPPHVQSLS